MMSAEADEVRTITANGIRQAVRHAGPADGAPVLLIHGLGWDHDLWTDLVDSLVGDGHQVIAPDLRGMGQTEKPDEPYTIDLYRRDLSALLDVLNIGELSVVGFSLGGMIAAALALADSRVVRLVLACCTLNSEPEGERATEAMLARAVREGRSAFARAQADVIWAQEWAAAHPEEVARFIEKRSSMDQAALHRAFRASAGLDLRAACADLHCPTLVLASDEDPFVPEASARAVAAAIPKSEYRIFAAGHMLPVEQPRAFAAAVVEFLAGT